MTPIASRVEEVVAPLLPEVRLLRPPWVGKLRRVCPQRPRAVHLAELALQLRELHSHVSCLQVWERLDGGSVDFTRAGHAVVLLHFADIEPV